MTTAVKLDRAHCLDTITKMSVLRCFEMDKSAEAYRSESPRKVR